MEVDERIWRIMQKRLGYTDEEAQRFKQDPRNADVLAKSRDLMSKVIVLEVVESHGCNSGHKVGDKFYFDTVGNLLTELCPRRVCGYSLSSALLMVYAANEMICAGADPNQMRFRRAGCSARMPRRLSAASAGRTVPASLCSVGLLEVLG